MNHLRQMSIPPLAQWALWIALTMVVTGFLGLAVNPAFAALATDPIPNNRTVRMQKGSSTLTRDPRTITADNPTGDPMPTLTPENCVGIRNSIIEHDALTRVSGANVYKCIIEYSAPVSFRANATCAPPRPIETRHTACPNDPERLFTQTQTWTIAPHPTCEVAAGWVPATPSAEDCPPPVLGVPSGVTATAVSSSEIRVSWGVVPDALAYSLRRCIGATCDPMSQPALRCVQGLAQPHVTLGAGITVRYQVQASRTADCLGELSAPSTPVVSATTLTGTTPPPPPPPPPPTACAGRVCTVSWSHDGPVADGFRVVYGTNENELVRVIQVTPGTVRTTQVTMPAAGVWYFGVRAYIGANESAVSNIRVQTVQ
jgi:hypothetical protein